MIELDSVEFAFPDGNRILRGLSLSITRGERVVLLGANGCGKSTLLKLVNGLLFAQSGEFRFEGRPVNARSLNNSEFRLRLRRSTGLVFQHPEAMFFNATVREEIAYGPDRFRHEDPDRLAARWAQRLNLTRQLERAPFELSGGEKQRLALACVLACEPDVLLLDEPVANLDPRSVDWLVDYLAGLDGRTLLTSTQNLTTAAAFGDRALLLGTEGRLLFDGPLVEVLNNPALLTEAGLR